MQQAERFGKLYRREKIFESYPWREKYDTNNYFCHNDGMFATTNDESFPGLEKFTEKMEILIEITNDEKQAPSGILLNKWHQVCKAELPKVGIFFCTQFPCLGIFINKKVGNRKN